MFQRDDFGVSPSLGNLHMDTALNIKGGPFEVETADCPQPWSSPLAGTASGEKRCFSVNRITRYYGLLIIVLLDDGYIVLMGIR